ncbi:uncharacterized protein LOC142616093 [Castanea sativa]|uniref:uncharacterized protein LOC142616093 n=1 Tax=Castanea sativa TaxID=21020 RepID=UPI003F650A31
MEIQKRPSIEEVLIFSIQSVNSWMAPIVSFLQDGHLPHDALEAKRIKTRAARLTILNDTLYKRGFSMPYLKCVIEEEAKLDEAKGAWLEELPSVLWAYRTTARTPTGETPFRLTYGTEAVIPVEVGVASVRREVFHEKDNDNQLRINLDCLDEIRDKASSKTAKYQRKMAEYYNKRVKLRRLEIGDLVLRKVTTVTKNSAQGKLGPTWEGPYRIVHYSRQGSYHLETLDGQRLPRPWNIENLKEYHQQM